MFEKMPKDPGMKDPAVPTVSETTEQLPQPSPVEVELRQLADRLRDPATAPEPLGTCVFAVGDKAVTAQTTELQCAMLNGTWCKGAEAAQQSETSAEQVPATPVPVEEAVTQLQSKLAAAPGQQAEEMGVCVYAAGDRACQAGMSQLQCELLGGVWFRGETEAAAGQGPVATEQGPSNASAQGGL
ncbi:MAG TPA: hypothetical protein VMV94_17695 [Phycisphaerae bacterium]|nr:hypothetical protein [Phycisphaerae bacterium]